MEPNEAPAQQPQPAAPTNVALSFGSGASASGPFPEELRRWNWGAFFFTWIWSLSNNVYVGLLSLVPVINIYVIIALGIKGNEWAWKHRRFESVEQFKKVQRAWARWGAALFLVGLLGFGGLVALSFQEEKSVGSQLEADNAKNDAIRKNDINSLGAALNAYANDERNGGYLPTTLYGLGKNVPLDPEFEYDYDYLVSDSGATGEVCALLSSGASYCQSAEVPESLAPATN